MGDQSRIIIKRGVTYHKKYSSKSKASNNIVVLKKNGQKLRF